MRSNLYQIALCESPLGERFVVARRIDVHIQCFEQVKPATAERIVCSEFIHAFNVDLAHRQAKLKFNV